MNKDINDFLYKYIVQNERNAVTIEKKDVLIYINK